MNKEMLLGSLGSAKIIGCDSFRCREKIKKIVLEEGVESIEENAFRMCSVRELELPVSLRSIGADAFRDCDALQVVEIPAGCVEFNLSAFDKCDGVKEIWIKGLNTKIKQIREIASFWIRY